MQPTKSQVQCSLEALQIEPDTATAHAAFSTSAGDEYLHRSLHDTREELRHELPEGLLAQLDEVAPLRTERLAEARAHIAEGDTCSDAELADRIVGRLVCDRLR